SLLFYFVGICPPLISPLFPYTTLFRSGVVRRRRELAVPATQPAPRADPRPRDQGGRPRGGDPRALVLDPGRAPVGRRHEVTLLRSEEHTSELQSRSDLVCRLLLEKKNN